MDCRRAQEHLLTDYLDNEISPEGAVQLKAHMEACPECRRFADTVRKTAHDPFLEAENQRPDEAVWLAVRRRIQQEGSPSTTQKTPADRLSWLVGILQPKPAFALASITAVALLAVAIFSRPSQENMARVESSFFQVATVAQTTLTGEAPGEQIELLAYFDDDDEIGGEGYGTDIEEYFL